MGLFDKAKDAAANAVGQAQAGLDKAKGDFAASRRDEKSDPRSMARDSGSANRPIMELESHIEGKNARVQLWPDRLEWERPRGVSGGKITAGVMTAGLSLLATGVKGGKDEHDMVLLKHVTNVASRKDGLMYYAVEVQTASGGAINSVAFRVSKDEAVQFRTAILAAVGAQEEKSNAPVVVQQTAPVSPSAAPDLGAQLQQLASLRDAGILTEEEFATKKADILARF
ncbi:SHOCT domain-containing protein [Microbacterium sp. 179-I 3D4 NHS]|uniref:SHOCT domain-containing protein n=1 Tax=Microbacterium sp. 179-I 3D4 NHS TaxID=3142381 RepID=UPI0039A01C74